MTNPGASDRDFLLSRSFLAAWLLASVLVQSTAGAPVSADPQLIRGPYLQSCTPSQVTFRWRTDVSSDSEVRYGFNPSNLDKSVTDKSSVTEHVITVTGLSPGTLYYYSVGTTTKVLAGGDSDHFAKTAVPGGVRQPVRIWVIGDAGTANSDQKAVRDAYLSYAGSTRTDVWLMLGDNAYSDGTDSEYEKAVFDIYPMLLRQVPVWPTLGNHDAKSADSGSQSGVYYNIFTLPKGGEAGGVASGTEAYYSYDHANVHFICLDSEDTDTKVGGSMWTWLDGDLSSTNQDWIIAYWHHPPYSKGSHDSDGESDLYQMRERIVPLLEDYGVDLVLSGHSHSYERSFLLDGHYGKSDTLKMEMILDGGDGKDGGDGAYFKPQAPHGGAVYVVAGSSGKTSGGSLDHPAMFYSADRLGSVVIDVDDQSLNVKFLRETGKVDDFFTMNKSDLALVAEPDVVSSGDTVTFKTLQGNAGDPALLLWSSPGGSGFGVMAVGNYDASGRWTRQEIVPTGLAGLKLELQSIGLTTAGRIAASNIEILEVQ